MKKKKEKLEANVDKAVFVVPSQLTSIYQSNLYFLSFSFSTVNLCTIENKNKRESLFYLTQYPKFKQT